jgi:signal transduction histidine kinase
MKDTSRNQVAGPAPSGPDPQHNVPVIARTGPSPRWTLLVLPVLIGGLLAVTIALDVATPATGPGIDLAPGYGWPYALLGLILAALATVILLHDVRQGFGWVLAWFGLFWVLDGLSQSYVRYAVRADEALTGSTLAAWFLNRFGAFLPATVAVLLLIFPTGRFLAGRWGVVGRVVLGAMVLAAFAVIVSPTTQDFVDVDLPPGFDVNWATLPIPASYVQVLAPVAGAVTALGVLLSMVSVIVRYRRSEGLERDRMRWLLWAVIAMAVILALTAAFELDQLRDAVILAVAALPAVAMTIAIVRPRVVPVEDLVSRTIVYGLLTLTLVLVDLAALAGLTALLGDALGQRQVVLTVLVLTAVLYGPLRNRLSRAVRRLMLGDRANPYDAVAGLASTLETADEGADQLAAVARAVASAFGVRYVSVEVERGGGERLAATYGDRPDETRTLPITYRDVPVGRLVLPARGLRSRLSKRDEQLLGDLVRQAAAAARSSRMADELQEGRERLVVAREEERRRIRRDLHDGLGPALSGVVFRLESARLLVDRDPEAAKGHLQATSDQVKDVVADVRRLVHDLRPPALDDRGLVGAVSQLGESLDLPLRIDEVGSADGSLPAAVEVAAYRIAAEALTNVARHAGASEVVVRIEAGEDALVLEVADDGAGIDEQAQAGVGLLSLRERAAELGGTSEVACPPGGGTVVRARLPMRRPVARAAEHEDLVGEPVGETR